MSANNQTGSVAFEQAIENSIHYRVRKNSVFIDSEAHAHYLRYGWCKIKNVVSSDEIKSFLNTYNHICTVNGFEIGNQFLNTGCLPNAEIRQKTSEVINLNVQTILPRMFDMNQVANHTGGAFVIKPPHEESELSVHQDSSFIDEETDYSLFMWVPFCDVTEKNGPILVLSGSHLWGNTQRGFGLPWNLQKHSALLSSYLSPVYANAGDVILFDPALVHASAPNLSSETRPAITITVVRRNPELIYFYRNSELPENLVEKYYVDEEFFKTYDFASKPNESIWRKEVVPYKSFDYTGEDIQALINQHLPEEVLV